ncbi:MAG: SDR family NAD(P)-dependent oxidoreductase, partial [Chloroflexota bacterium]
MSEGKERYAIVTGSGRGIGRAIALELARSGVNVAVNFFRNRETAEQTAQDIEDLGVRSLLLRANVGDIKELENLFSSIEQEWPGLDILVNNAASGYNRPIEDQKPRGWDWTMNINARSVLFGSQFALPLMKKRGAGHIVNITSMGSQRVLPDYSVVGASKAAIETLTRYLAHEFAKYGISVNAVSPGMVITEALS